MTRALSLLLTGFVVAVAAANIAYRASADTGADRGSMAWSRDRMEFVAWNGVEWTAWIHAGAFELVPKKSGRWHRHRSPSIAFIDWQGEPWQAKLDDGRFVLARKGHWEDELVEDESIRYRDWAGNNQLRTVADLAR